MPGAGPRRVKSIVLVAAIVASGLTIVAWSQPWFSVALVDEEQGGATVGVAGDVAASGLAGLGLAGLALVGALSIAGRVIRLILGAVQLLIGATVTLTALDAVVDPVDASAAAITQATGISGSDSIAGLVRSVTPGFWPFAAVVLGVSVAVIGIVIIVTSARWPESSRKYRAVPATTADDSMHAVATPAREDAAAPADAAGPDSPPADSIADWDALSDGSDPTSR